MKDFGDTLKKIYHEVRLMLVMMIFNAVLTTLLFIVGVVNLNPSSAVVKIGYGDIGGYRSGSWADMLTFPLLAIIFGVFHNIIAMRIFKKRGAGMTKFFLVTTTALIAGAVVVLLRLLEKV